GGQPPHPLTPLTPDLHRADRAQRASVLGNLDRSRFAASINDLRPAPLRNLTGPRLAVVGGKAKPTATLQVRGVVASLPPRRALRACWPSPHGPARFFFRHRMGDPSWPRRPSSSWLAVVFSAGGDGGRRSPNRPIRAFSSRPLPPPALRARPGREHGNEDEGEKQGPRRAPPGVTGHL